ncbi:MAG TPA: HAMP domain-containing protein [Candidatus Dormibacteraeota bacterium]
MAATTLAPPEQLDQKLLLKVLTDFKRGDFSARMPSDLTGMAGKIADTLNDVIEISSRVDQELMRVGRVVGKEGRINQRASLGDVSGGWRSKVDSVNTLIEDLTAPTIEMARVISAVAAGDLSQQMATDVDGRPLQGSFARFAKTVNTMVAQLGSFTSEVTRVAREVGTEGKLGGQAKVRGVAGVWRELTDSVNLMASNLTAQVRSIADVTTAVANGDLSKKITVEGQGEILELKNTINVMVDQLNAFSGEVTRVAREVGTDGKLGGQAQVPGVGGVWRDLTDNVNLLAGQLTSQIRNIAEVTTAVANGDLSKKVTVDVKGEILELKNTINVMVDQLNAFAGEVTRVAREVGTEGKLGGQADVRGVGGTWKDLTDNVNTMAGQLTSQIRNIAEVTTAVANGDLSKKITVEGQGEILELKDTINVMVDQLNAFAGEVTRVAREVGTEGKLGGQAEVRGVGGVWNDLTDNVNLMAGQLTSQIRNIAEVTTAVANGDLTKKITVDVRGEILELKNTINVMVDQLNAFAGEVTRVAREVGTEGKLGGQADVRGVGGTWKDLTDNVNLMAGQLTSQIRNIADVTTAVAKGDLSKKITVEGQGEILELKNTINVMVDQLNAFSGEVSRVAREVGTDGKLGGQAQVPGVAGVWRDLTDNVNLLAGQLTSQIRNIAEVTTAVANGDLSKKVTVDVQGEILELKQTINVMVDQLNAFASEVTRVAREVGTEGKLGGQADVRGVGGTWKDLTDNVNLMAGQLTGQVRGIARVVTAVANGDLSKKITVDVSGEILELKNTVNVMVDQLNAFASEVTRVAREVGTEGKLGGQAEVPGVAGVWKDLTDNVNSMAGNLTDQVRGIAGVVTAVAQGDLRRKLTVEAKGEVAALAETINEMTDTLATFADQVTTVAREVGVEGRLGAQAAVPGAAGTWKDLTDNVNQLAAQLTTQIRAMADVSTAVTEGDLTRSVTVEAAGEVAVLKDKVNEMIGNLRVTTRRNAEQDWLKTNLNRFTRLMQGQRDLVTVARTILSELAPLVNAQHGVFYTAETVAGNDMVLRLHASYAYRERKGLNSMFRLGEGLVGQCALEKQRILLHNVPGDYVQISSGLGGAAPLNIIVLPVLFEGEVKAVIELASFETFSDTHKDFLDQLTESIGIVLNTIEANMRTEELLVQSQSLANELQSRQEELQQTNAELEEKARLLADQNQEVERKNLEVEQARSSLEEKAQQLEITSKYKSEFLANMSHELRTPLNSLLILAQQLSDNPEGNLTDKQVEFANIIHSSGQDLLALINEILDLSKIESGTVVLDYSDVPLAEMRDFADLNFRHLAENKRLSFEVSLADDAPATIQTDPKRLQQILRNLLSNAVKFTEEGSVELSIERASGGWSKDNRTLREAPEVIAFRVQDTGIGIPADKHKTVFEAFQQADGTTSRKFGGTGLGLNISRELVKLMGGEIGLHSVPGEGSTFTVYLPAAAPDSVVRQEPDSSVATAISQALDLPPVRPAPAPPRAPRPEPAVANDDRLDLNPGDRILLIVEDDPNFASVVLEIAHRNKFKGLIAHSADQAFQLAKEYEPDAITLDIGLPGRDGWQLYDQLLHDPSTAGIPVHVVSVRETDQRRGAESGLTFLTKPVTKDELAQLFARIKAGRPHKGSLLVVEDEPVQRREIVRQFVQPDLEVVAVGTGTEGLEILKKKHFDCVVLDLGLPDMTGSNFIDAVQADPFTRSVPIVVYTSLDLSRRAQAKLKKMTRGVVMKDPDSSQELLEEVGHWLRGLETMATPTPARTNGNGRSAAPKRAPSPPGAAERPGQLTGKRLLVVDDDVRNIYALTALLEREGAEVLNAESGVEAIELLGRKTRVDAVLMDVMMPELDGLQTTAVIRENPEFQGLPIIAVTAKAMQGDRERCLEAGASDYIAKPVDAEQLVELVRRWTAGAVGKA